MKLASISSLRLTAIGVFQDNGYSIIHLANSCFVLAIFITLSLFSLQIRGIFNAVI